MKNYLKKRFQKEIKSRGYQRIDFSANVLVPRVPKEKVEDLIRKLHPYKVGIELIRLGPNRDGGYLVPDDLDGIEACFSPGVSLESGFELDCHKLGMQLFMADKSVDKPNFNLPESAFAFTQKFVGCTNNEDFISMDSWVNSSHLKDTSDLLLQMDIEGGEYFTFMNMTDVLIKRFRIMVVEFHGLRRLWLNDFYQQANTVFSKILHTHTCVHIHPNNCCGINIQKGVAIPPVTEFTFIRNDRVKHKEFQTQFPNPLDVDNTEKEHIALPRIWYNQPS